MRRFKIPKSMRGCDKQTEKKYLRQLELMFSNAMKWRVANPTREALVMFNYAPNVCIIAPISEGLRRKIVTTNDAGLELLKALWPTWKDETEPTVLMCRCVLEHVPPPKRPPPTPCPHCQQKITVRGGFKARGDTADFAGDVEPGAINFCMNCCGFSWFNEDMTLRAMTPDELDALPESMREAFKKIIEAVKANPPPPTKR